MSDDPVIIEFNSSDDENDEKEVKDPVEVVKFSGLARHESGKLTRHNYFKFLRNDLDDYTDLDFSPEEAQKVHMHLLKMSTGSAAMTPMYCGGEICPFKRRCVFYEMGKAPLGRQCLVEVELMKQWVVDYMEEFDVDPQNFTEVAYANELAEIMILERRLNMNLAKADNAELVIDATVGVDREGDAIIQKQVSPFMELKDKLARRRSNIIKLMVGDRQEKYKKEAALKVKLDSDPSGKMSKMRGQLENLHRQLDTMEKKTTTPQEERRNLSPEDLIDNPSE
jgi:hypothetical protein